VRKNIWINVVLILGLLSSVVLANEAFELQKNWPSVLDLDVRNFEGNLVYLNVDSMNASLAYNDFEPLNNPFWGFSYGSYMKTAPHTNINFGVYSNQLFKSSQKGAKKASFSLQSVGIQMTRDFTKDSFSLTPKAGVGFSIGNLALMHKKSDNIYEEPREVLAKGFYVSGFLGLNMNYNFNQIIGINATGEIIGGYKLFTPIKDLDSYKGYKLGLGFVITMPL